VRKEKREGKFFSGREEVPEFFEPQEGVVELEREF